MTKSKWSARTVAGFRIRPQTRDGRKTGKWFADVPKSSNYGRRRRVLFETVHQAESFAVDLAAKLATINARGVGAGHPTPIGYGNRLPTPITPAIPVTPVFAAVDESRPQTIFGEAVELWKQSSRDKIAVGKKRETSHATDLARLKPLLEVFAHTPLAQINELNWGAYLRQRMETDGYAPEYGAGRSHRDA